MRRKIQFSRMLGMALIFQGMVFDKNNTILDLSVTIFIELEIMCINEDPVSHLKVSYSGALLFYRYDSKKLQAHYPSLILNEF